VSQYESTSRSNGAIPSAVTASAKGAGLAASAWAQAAASSSCAGTSLNSYDRHKESHIPICRRRAGVAASVGGLDAAIVQTEQSRQLKEEFEHRHY
jgi:hypothetical protein